MAQVQIPAGAAVLDFSVYPRHALDPFNLSQLRQAMAAGAIFPPPLLQEGTLRVVDGFHRITVWKEARGDDGLIDAETRAYPDEAALFAEALLLNSRHGRNLTTYDRLKSILIARKLGIPDGETAQHLQITTETLDSLVITRTGTGDDGRIIPLKLTSAPAGAGRSLTAQQLAANDRAGGMPVGYYCGQIVNALAGDLVNWSDGHLTGKLQHLHDLLGEALAKLGTE